MWEDMLPQDITTRWREEWKLALVVNNYLVVEPAIRHSTQGRSQGFGGGGADSGNGVHCSVLSSESSVGSRIFWRGGGSHMIF